MKKSVPLQLINFPDNRQNIKRAISAYVDRAVAKFGGQIASITLYGSQARGDAEPGSDIDLLIVLRQDSPTLRQALADLAWQVQYEYDVVISDIIRNSSQFTEMQENHFPLFRNIEREGIVLWKNPSELMPAYD